MKLTMLVSRLFKFFIPSTIEEIASKMGFMKALLSVSFVYVYHSL